MDTAQFQHALIGLGFAAMAMAPAHALAFGNETVSSQGWTLHEMPPISSSIAAGRYDWHMDPMYQQLVSDHASQERWLMQHVESGDIGLRAVRLEPLDDVSEWEHRPGWVVATIQNDGNGSDFRLAVYDGKTGGNDLQRVKAVLSHSDQYIDETRINWDQAYQGDYAHAIGQPGALGQHAVILAGHQHAEHSMGHHHSW